MCSKSFGLALHKTKVKMSEIMGELSESHPVDEFMDTINI